MGAGDLQDGDILHLRSDTGRYANVNLSNTRYGFVMAQRETKQGSSACFVIEKAPWRCCSIFTVISLPPQKAPLVGKATPEIRDGDQVYLKSTALECSTHPLNLDGSSTAQNSLAVPSSPPSPTSHVLLYSPQLCHAGPSHRAAPRDPRQAQKGRSDGS